MTDDERATIARLQPAIGSEQMTEKPKISAHEAEELIKGMGRECLVVVQGDGLVSAVAISAHPGDPRVQMEVDSDIQRKYRIVKRR
jgi:hypothetical protein